MGWYYRKRKGGMNFSLSRRGPRVSVGFGGGKGCLLPALLALVVVAISAIIPALRRIRPRRAGATGRNPT